MKKAIIAILVLGMLPLFANADLTGSPSKNVMKWYADRNGGDLPPADAFRIAASVDGVVSVVHWTAQMGAPQPTDAVINAQGGNAWWAAREIENDADGEGWTRRERAMWRVMKKEINAARVLAGGQPRPGGYFKTKLKEEMQAP